MSKALASGEVDVCMHFVGPLVIELDAGDPISSWAACTWVVSSCSDGAGSHDPGSEGQDGRDHELGSTQHVFLASMVAHVGLDPRKDINWS